MLESTGRKFMRRRSLLAFAATAAVGIAVPLALAQPAAAYPERPITIIGPWGPGGGPDATARIIASVPAGELGQSVSVVNRPGGAGVVGRTGIGRAGAGGYTR